MRVFGKVKSFDRTAGTGCAVSDSGAQAAFTRETLKPFGLSAIDAGVALTFELTLERGRLIVAEIYEIAGKPPHPQAAGATPVPPDLPDRQRVKGRVHWFDAQKGFGFVISNEIAGDVLLHRSVLDAIGVGSIREGAVLDFDLIWKIKGPQVTFIHAVLPPAKPFEPVVAPPAGGSIVIGDDMISKLFGFRQRFVAPPIVLGPRRKGFGFIMADDLDDDEDDDEAPFESAVCKWFSRPKGFGFLSLEDSGEDAFVHMDVLRQCGLAALRPGQRVRVRVARSGRGLSVTDIELDDDA